MKNILIIGANKGIGVALLKKISQSAQHNIIAVSRDFQPPLFQKNNKWYGYCDISREDSIDALAQNLHEHFKHLDWLINCAGVLHTNDYYPEKALSQLNSKQLIDNFSINAAGHLLLIKKLEKLIAAAKQPLVTSISARIGSITDNQLGGWYAYRMSKAALNMGMKTLSIEWKRKYPHIKTLLIHPGTTDTDLSKPFQKRLKKGMLQTPEQTADYLYQQMLKREDGTLQQMFVDYKGHVIEW